VRRLQADDTSIPPSGSGRASLIAALALAATTLLLLRLGSGHTAESQRFAALPEFRVWTWAYAAYAAAAAAVGLATLPAFRLLGQAAGRPATIWAVAAWAVVGLLITIFGPRALPAHSPLWLQSERVTAANLVCGIFVTPSFAGLLLVQTRLSALRRETPSRVAADRAGGVVVELLWLRAALQRFLVSFGVLISSGLLATGALRGALLADGVSADVIPGISLLTYGAFFTALAALIFVPAYVAWQGQVVHLKDNLYPVPENGLPSRDWHQARSDFDNLLSARSSAGSVFAAAFGVLAPLAGGLVTALIPTP
jgi:hypothetical protein